MKQRLAEKTAAVVTLSRNILANTAAGLITAALIGFWSPMLKQAEPLTPPQTVGKINIDPVSGKILDRIDGAEKLELPTVRLKPVLVGYALPALTDETEANSATAAARRPRETGAAKAQSGTQVAPKAARASASPPESRNIPDEAPVAPLAPTQTAEGDGWMSRFSPGALSAKIAPVSGYVSGGVAAAKRAVSDRLGAIGF